MARLQHSILGGVLVLTVTVLLNTRPAEAAGDDCSGGDVCQNGGSCPEDTGVTPCNCSGVDFAGDTCQFAACHDTDSPCQNSGTCTDEICTCTGGYLGDLCEKACDEASDCNDGTCNTDGDCECTGGYKGDFCQDACEDDDGCGTNGTCNTDDTPKTCTCSGGYGGDMCGTAPECTDADPCDEDEFEVCDKEVTPYKCACKSGYKLDDDTDKCVKSGSTLVQVSLLSLLMSLIVSAM